MQSMKSRTVIALSVVLLILLAACSSKDEPTDTQPTATTVAEPTATATAVAATQDPAEAVVDVAVADPAALVRHPWQWVKFTDPLQKFEIDDPENYVVTFSPDGTAQIKADCNNASGAYQATQDGSISIDVGPMTTAMCPPESRSDEFIDRLSWAAIYFFEGDSLFIDLMADGGTMAFVPAGEAAMADDGVRAMAGSLIASPWQWTSFTNPMEQFDVEMPESYLLTFNTDGTVSIKADCNNAGGSYTGDGSRLTIQIGPMTMAACPPESRSDQFVQLLGGAAIYFFEEDNLYIDLMADGGTMAFAPTDAAGLTDFDPDAEPLIASLTGGGNEGVWLDPTLISVKSGVLQGPAIDASQLGIGCAGNVPAHPDVVMNWAPDDDVDTLRIFFMSGGDPTMVVVTPIGEVLCSDDLSPLVLDPYIEIADPPAGRYAVYMGSFENDATEPGFLVFTGHDVNPATLDIAQIVPRKVDPAALGEPISVDVLDMSGTPVAISPDDTPFQQEMVGGGALGAFNIELDNHLCTGFIDAAPTFSFDWSGEAEKLVIFFEGDTDSTLIVHTPIDTYACDDDVHGANNLNPALDLTAIPGTYHVWVGSFAPDTPVRGALTIAGTPELQPEPLTSDMIKGQ